MANPPDPLDELYAWLEPGIAECRSAARPCVIAITGSVAVGKSTIVGSVREALSALTDTPRVDVVSTDGFLYPNRVLEARGLDAQGVPRHLRP